MGKFSSPKKQKRQGGLTAVLLILVAALAIGLTALLAGRMHRAAPAVQAQPEETHPGQTVTEPVTAAPTEAPFTPVASGGKEQVRYRASYTGAYSESAAQTVVATAGDRQLTGAVLQILYLNQVNAYRVSGGELAPDFNRPLDTQRCPLEEGLSWQQYFLKRAIGAWQAQEAVLYAAAQPQTIAEEDYAPNVPDEKIHEKYIAPELPLNDFLYQDQDSYHPNKVHQAYLDGLEQVLDELFQTRGFSGLTEAGQVCQGTTAEQWKQAAIDFNTAYMYFTECSYAVNPTDGEVSDYLRDSEHASSARENSGETVDIRQILVVPEGSVSADGTVSATEESWEAARQRAEELLKKWKSANRRSAEAEFAQLASEESDDAGSRCNGGYYGNIRPGVLIAPLDEWCFANGRQLMDSEIIRSEVGYHLVLLTAFRETNLDNAEAALVCSLQRQQWSAWLEKRPLTPDYEKITLWADTTQALPALTDSLYPDIAHQRFPEAIVYLQQDYFYHTFGDRQIGKNGCGITTWAMLATYMTDSLQTPAMMADRFLEYYDYRGHSTNGDIFSYAPAEMGFYLDKMAFDIDTAIEALENGQVLVSRQYKGHFTSSGHFLLVTRYNEEDDTFQVRDSNIYNYGKLKGHQVDRFTRANLLSGGGLFYIMQPKVVAIPACARCGGSFLEHQPQKLLNEDYICEKCTAALSRRNHFLTLLDEFSAA